MEHDVEVTQEYMAQSQNWDNMIGYKISDITTNTIHVILELREFPQQIMAVINTDKKELLVPLNDEFIDDIDHDKRIIQMSLPEGLLDL